jgi:hypothetical protein
MNAIASLQTARASTKRVKLFAAIFARKPKPLGIRTNVNVAMLIARKSRS